MVALQPHPARFDMIHLLAALFLFLAWSAAQAGERVVRILNRSDYIDPGVLEDFTRETGVKVVYDTYESSDALEARLTGSGVGYDIVVAPAHFVERWIKARLAHPVDRGKLANADNIAPEIDARLSRYDPGSGYAVPYMWRATGVAYNVAKIAERIGRPIVSWEQVLKPEALRKLADYGVYMFDSPEDMFPTALRFLKLDPDSKSPAELRKAAEHLGSLRKYVRKFHSSEHIGALAAGDACLAIGWTGDGPQARSRARDAGVDVDIASVIPVEGGPMSLDAVLIPEDARHLPEASLFIDYLLRPDIAARNSRVTNFASGVDPARAPMDKSIADDPAIYPGEAVMRRLYIVTSANPEQSRLIARLWTTMKAGR